MEVIRKRPAAAQAGARADSAWEAAEARTIRRHADRLLFEARLVGLDDLVEARNVVDSAGKYDLHDLARLANDLVACLVPPLACGIEHGESVREAGHDLAIDETAKV